MFIEELGSDSNDCLTGCQYYAILRLFSVQLLFMEESQQPQPLSNLLDRVLQSQQSETLEHFDPPAVETLPHLLHQHLLVRLVVLLFH